MKLRNGGKLLVDCLQALGVTKSFGVPGESYLCVLDALYDTQGTLDFILCRHEGGAAFMAAAWGKLTGAPGICFVTRGPGATNASIGVHTAMQDSAPMILFIGQVGTRIKGREAFQEIDYRACFGSVAKWVTEIDHVERIPEVVSRAWTMTLSGRPGPVVIALPEDMLTERSGALPLSRAISVEEAAPSDMTIDKVLSALSQAETPLIIMGGGGWKATGSAALQAFAEASDLPVLAAFRFQDRYDNHSETYVGDASVSMTAAIRELIRSADLIIAINIRFGEMTTDGYSLLNIPSPVQKLVHVHASDRELGKIYAPEIAIHAGPNTFSEALAEKRVRGPWAAWREKARSDYLAAFEVPDQPGAVDMGRVMASLRRLLPDDAILTSGAGNFTVWPNKFFRFSAGQRLLAPQSGAMGYGLPAAIAARIASPERTVVCFCGDGDFQMTCQELGTAVQSDAQPIILILNNGIYGTIRMHQECAWPGRVIGTTLKNPDFITLATSYGYHGEHVTRTEDFEAAFERAQESGSGAVLELDISPEALTPLQTLSQMRASALAASKQ